MTTTKPEFKFDANDNGFDIAIKYGIKKINMTPVKLEGEIKANWTGQELLRKLTRNGRRVYIKKATGKIGEGIYEEFQ